MLYYKKLASPLGEITLRSDGEALTGLWFADDKHYGAKDIEGAALADLDVFTQAEAWMAEYFAGREPGLEAAAGYSLWQARHLRRYCQENSCTEGRAADVSAGRGRCCGA